LRLLETYVKKVERAEDLDAVNDNLIPPLLDAILGDYASNSPWARDAEVLNVVATITDRLKARFIPQVIPTLDAVFEPTLNMINKDFTEYPEHRVGLYRLLSVINRCCFDALLNIATPQFKLFMDSVIWAIKHTMRDIADMGLSLCAKIVDNFASQSQSISNAFYQQYFLSILQDIFWVVTDADHKSGFRLQSQLLARMFELVETGQVQMPLFDPTALSDPNVSNSEFVRDYCISLLQTAFTHLQLAQVQAFIANLFQYHNDPARFKLAMRDFLVQLKEFSGDNAELYLEEKEKEAQWRARMEHEAASRIPGMLKPSQLEDKDEDIA